MKIANIIHKFFYMNVFVRYTTKSKDELKEIDIKNHVCYYFDDTINCTDISFNDILLDQKHMKILQFMTFHIKPQQIQIYFVLGSIK